MAVNNLQKIAVLPINGVAEQTINNYLALGYVIQFIVNLNPAINSLLIVYSTPEYI